MKVNDEIITDLKSRQNLIDKKCGEGSTNKLIELSERLSSLYDERRKVVFDSSLSKEEKLNRLLDIRRSISEVGSDFVASGPRPCPRR